MLFFRLLLKSVGIWMTASKDTGKSRAWDRVVLSFGKHVAKDRSPTLNWSKFDSNLVQISQIKTPE